MANLSRWLTANDIINRAAVEVGLNPVNDVFSAGDPNFQSMRYLLNSCGQELIQEFEWQQFERSVSFTTGLNDSGTYELPADFSYMIDQTGWQKGVPGSATPLLGPSSPQYWTYLEASKYTSVSIYAWFRVAMNSLILWPQPPPANIPIMYKYVSRAWVKAGDQADTYRDNVTIPSDVVMYEPILIVKMLKASFLQAKGFDTTKAEDEYQLALDAWKGKNKPAPKLNVSTPWPGDRFLDWRNTPETGFGS